MAPYGAELRAVAEHFSIRPWTVKQIAVALAIGESTAREMKNSWLAAELIAEAQLGRWYLTEKMVQEVRDGG